MSSYCQQCGSQLSPESVFCSSCGTKVAQEIKTKSGGDELEAFFGAQSNLDLQKDGVTSHSQSVRHCIVFTNRSVLEQLCGSNARELEIRLRRYLIARYDAGWRYHILDASKNRFADVSGKDWQDHVALLRQAVTSFKERSRVSIDAVMLLGDESVIPMPCFDNYLYGDVPDADVDSDLPYSSLSENNPFESDEALEPQLAVARIPTGRMDHGSLGVTYFSGDPRGGEEGGDSQADFGISAEVWDGASKAVAEAAGIKRLYICPNESFTEPVGQPDSRARYLYFNVHGSDEMRDWVGESKLAYDYPTAINPPTIASFSDFNAIATEACYGARFIGHSIDQSALLTSLSNKTVVFSGSSRIAFGPAEPPVGLADIIAQNFLYELKKGTSAGEAFRSARLALLGDDFLTPHDQLTVVEFNLFGDPTRCLPARADEIYGKNLPKSISGGGKAAGSPLEDALRRVNRSLETTRRRTRVVIPQVLDEVNASIDATWSSIASKMTDLVHDSSPRLQGVNPELKVFRMGSARSKVLRLSFKKDHENIFHSRIIYADRIGKILSDISSK